MPAYIPAPIAQRVLMFAGEPQRQVTVRLGRPSPATDYPGEWCCRFEIEGLDEPIAEEARSLDDMGALLNAIAGIRTRLDESGQVLNLYPQSDGDTGFPRYVPDFGDRAFTRSIEAYIDERMAGYVLPLTLFDHRANSLVEHVHGGEPRRAEEERWREEQDAGAGRERPPEAAARPQDSGRPPASEVAGTAQKSASSSAGGDAAAR